MPDAGRLLTAAIIVNAGVGIVLAIDPPWALWQQVGLGVTLGLMATAALYRLTRNL